MRTSCLITGCKIQMPDDSWYHGDLFEATLAGKRVAWILNTDASAPAHTALDADRDRALVCIHWPPFDRKGVFLIGADEAVLNRAARRYLEGAPHGSPHPR